MEEDFEEDLGIGIARSILKGVTIVAALISSIALFITLVVTIDLLF